MNLAKSTKNYQQNDEKLEQKDNQRSGTGLSRRTPLFSLLNVVVKDNIDWNIIVFLISHQVYTLKYSILHVERKFETF